jgi:hypothetical protein
MWGGLRRTLHSFLAIAFFAFLVLTSASQAAPIAEPEAEPGAEASPSGSTIFLCDIRSDGTMTCVTILGELEVCAQLPAGVIRRSYLADPEQQPSVVVPTTEDIDEAIKGTTSGDQGTIADVQETYGPGEGTLDIVPAEPGKTASLSRPVRRSRSSRAGFIPLPNWRRKRCEMLIAIS